MAQPTNRDILLKMIDPSPQLGAKEKDILKKQSELALAQLNSEAALAFGSYDSVKNSRPSRWPRRKSAGREANLLTYRHEAMACSIWLLDHLCLDYADEQIGVDRWVDSTFSIVDRESFRRTTAHTEDSEVRKALTVTATTIVGSETLARPLDLLYLGRQVTLESIQV